MEEKKRRRPGVEREIESIKEEDYRVRVIGIVVDRDPGNYSATIDDSTGRADVFFSRKEDFDIVEEGRLIRIIGKVIKDDEKLWIDAEIVQNMHGLDPALLKQVRYIEEKGG